MLAFISEDTKPRVTAFGVPFPLLRNQKNAQLKGKALYLIFKLNLFHIDNTFKDLLGKAFGSVSVFLCTIL